MNLNVLNDWSYSKRYYLTHPWKWVKELFCNLKNAYRRAKYGWAYSDCWNMDSWLLEILPQMLRHMADEGCAYPGYEPFETPEKWEDWLHSMADVLESLQEDNWYSQNEYAKDFHIRHNDKELDQLYFLETENLYNERQQLLENTFAQLVKNFNSLWD